MVDSKKEDDGSKLLPVLDQRISGNLARRFGIIPVVDEGDTTVFVGRSPLSEDQIRVLKACLGKMKFRLAAPEEFAEYRAAFERLLDRFPEFPPTLKAGDCDDLGR